MEKNKGGKSFSGYLLLIFLPFFWFFAVSVSAAAAVLLVLANTEVASHLHQQAKGFSPYRLFSSLPPILGASTFNLVTQESRPVVLEQFFAKYRSPLAAYGDLIISAAERHNIPWVLLPAIAGQESTFCRPGSYPEGSFNCWGWGIHTQYTKMFSSYEEAIEKVSKGLGEYYKTLGIDRNWPIERQVLAIKTLYNKTSLSWDRGVLYFIFELSSFSSS